MPWDTGRVHGNLQHCVNVLHGSSLMYHMPVAHGEVAGCRQLVRPPGMKWDSVAFICLGSATSFGRGLHNHT